MPGARVRHAGQPGGLVHATVAAPRRFVGRGAIVEVLLGRAVDGQEAHVWRARVSLPWRRPGDAALCYEFAGMNLLTAEWVQAWGSILGAMLGAGLAVVGAVWFERRKELQRERSVQRVAIRGVDRISAEAAYMLRLLKERSLVLAIIAALAELRRREVMLERFAPFNEMGSAASAAVVIDLLDKVASVTRFYEILQPNRTAAYLTDETNRLMLEDCKALIQAAMVAQGYLSRSLNKSA